MNLNPTINRIQQILSHGPCSAKELSDLVTNSEGKPIPLGNVIAILRASKWAWFDEETKQWELVQ